MIDHTNLIECFAKIKYWIWKSPNNDKYVVFEALPEETERSSRKTTSFVNEADAEAYLEMKRTKFIEDCKRRMQVTPIVDIDYVSPKPFKKRKPPF